MATPLGDRGRRAGVVGVALGFAASLMAVAVAPTHALAAANAIVPNVDIGGYADTALNATDDGSSGFTPFGFEINYFGTEYSGAYVNNNGNLTFSGPMASYTPFGLASAGTPILAPFFADVDTNSGNVVNYGTGTLDGYSVFVANWPGVECFPAGNPDYLDNFQAIIVDRPDLGTSGGDDFQIEFNYSSDPMGRGNGERRGRQLPEPRPRGTRQRWGTPTARPPTPLSCPGPRSTGP